MKKCSRCWVMLWMMVAGCGPLVERPEVAPEVTAIRTAAFGDESGDGALSSVFGVAESSDGRVFVSEPEFARVVEFDGDGAFVRVVGGRGKGPGEFQVPGALMWRADSLTVTDFLQGISLFSPDGQFGTRINFTIKASAGPFGGRPIFALPDGSVAATVPADQSAVISGAVTHEPWFKVTRTGEIVDSLALVPQAGRYYSVQLNGANRVGPHPFAWNPLLVAPPSGTSLVIVERDPALTAEPDSFRVVRLNVDGDTVGVGFVAYVPKPIPTQAIDSVATAIADKWARLLREKSASLAGSVKDGIVWPEWYPPVTEVVAGTDGCVWLRREDLGGESVEWDILDRDLNQVGRIGLPVALDVKVVGLDRIYAVELDGLDVPTVVRFTIAGTR